MINFLKNLFKKKKPPTLIEGDKWKIDTNFAWFYLDSDWLKEEAIKRNFISDSTGEAVKEYHKDINLTADSPPSSPHSTASSQPHSQESDLELFDDPYQIPQKEQE